MHSRSQYWPDVLVAEIPLHGKLPSPAAVCTVFTTITCSNFLSHRTPVFKNETSFCQYITSSQAHTSLFWIKPHPPPLQQPPDLPAFLTAPRELSCTGGAAVLEGRQRGGGRPGCPVAPAVPLHGSRHSRFETTVLSLRLAQSYTEACTLFYF